MNEKQIIYVPWAIEDDDDLAIKGWSWIDGKGLKIGHEWSKEFA